MMDFKRGSKERTFVIKVIKDDLVLKIFYHQLRESQKWYSVVILEEYEDFF